MKKSNLILVIGLIVMIFFFFAFQSKMHRYIDEIDRKEMAVDFVIDVRTTPAFGKMSISQNAMIYFYQDSVTQIKIEAAERLLPHIKTIVKDDELIIEKTKEIRKRDSVKIYISSKNLYELNVSSGTSFETMNKISGKDLKIEFSNDSKGALELSYESVMCHSTSGSKVKIKGDSKQVDFSN